MTKPLQASTKRKGFSDLASPAKVLSFLSEIQWPTSTENIEIDFRKTLSLDGRVLAEDVVSPVNVPDFPKAMMDGFAIESQKTSEASPANPIDFSVQGTQLAGNPVKNTSPAAPLSCLEIMTGSPVPSLFDAVIPFEQVKIHYKKDNQQTPDKISISEPTTAGKHIAPIGEDIKENQTILPAGHRIRIQDVGVFSTCQIPKISVYRPAKVDLFLTGDEIETWTGRPSRPQSTLDANGPVLSQLIQRDGGQLAGCNQVADKKSEIKDVIQSSNSEILIFCGGTSAGVADHLPEVVKECGELFFHGIDIRPGRPVGIGKVENRWIFLLPGNPIACYFAYDLLVGPCLSWFQHTTPSLPYKKTHGKLAKDVPSKTGRMDYLRVQIKEGEIEPITSGRSSNISTIATADGFCLIPEEAEQWKKGKEVEVWLF